MAPPGPTDSGEDVFLRGQLLDCPQLLDAGRVVVGFSGGLDSTLLLHLLAGLRDTGRLNAPLLALHVNHGLQAEANPWQEHCRRQAEHFGIPFLAQRVNVSQAGGRSPEAAAREARYAVFAGFMQPGSVLVLGHHADDQVETVLLHLLRGSGPRGLAGMPRQRELGGGRLCRPLLGVPRAHLLEHARQHELIWIEDPSNGDPRYTRNFLRSSVIPLLRQQAPGLQQGVLRSASLQAEAEQLLGELAAADLAIALAGQPNQLRAASLRQWSPARVRNLLRHWVRGLQTAFDGSDITHQALEGCIAQLLSAREDAEPLIAWGEAGRRLELRRFQDRLYLVKPMPVVPLVLDWDPALPLPLPGVLGSLRCITAGGAAPAAGTWPRLQVRFRQGGERLQVVGRPTHSLKQLLQERGVPPWLRPCVPLVWCGDSLLAAGDLFVHADWPALMPEKAARFIWDRQHLHCGW